MSEAASLADYGKLVVDAILMIFTVVFGYLSYKKSNRIKVLEEEKEYLKKKIHRVTSKVDPESDRQLLNQASKSVQIMGINSLGPLHHCREEMIEFLKKKKGELHIILLDPSSNAFRERELLENDDCMRLLSEWRASVSIIKDIKTHAGVGVELRLRSDKPDRSLFIIDALNGLNDKTKMLINYYPDEPDTRGYSGAQFLAEFVMERDRDSSFRNINKFQECWRHTNPITPAAAINLVNQVFLNREKK